MKFKEYGMRNVPLAAPLWRGATLLSLLLPLLLLSACNVTKHLDAEKGERLLTKNSLEFKSTKRVRLDQRTSLQYEMGGLYKQQPNRKLLGARPRLAAYYRYRNRTGKFARWVQDKYDEAPAIYDPVLAQRTANNFENFMRQRGYFDAKCTFKADSVGKHEVKVKYVLNFGPLYTISQTTFSSRDSNVLAILLETRNSSTLQPGTAVDGRQFDAEKLRITTLLRNRGYAFFIPNFIEFTGDSTNARTAVTVEVLPQNDSTWHQTYTLDDVSVFSSLVPDLNEIRQDTILDGVHFYSNQPKFFIKPKYLNRLVTTRPGQPYQLSDFEQTNKNLSSLGVFRFVAVRPKIDTLQPGKLDVDVSFAPANRLSLGTDFDLNYSTSSVTGGLLGVSSSAFARHRNLLGGAEQILNNLQYNVEFDPTTPRRFIFSQEVKVQNDLTIPRFFDYFGLWRGLHHLHVGKRRAVTNSFYQRLKQDGRAHIGVSYNYLDLTNFYRYNLFNASFGYDIQADKQHAYSFDHIGIDVLRPTLDPEFRKRSNPLLLRSFQDQLFTGFVLRAFTYSLATPPNAFGERWFFRFNSDVSGLEEHLVNRLWVRAFGPQEWTIDGLKFAKYVHLETSGSYTRNYTKQLAAAVRVGSGVVVPFGDSEVAPYVKQFFVGGPSSIRAWRIRELGPGAFHNPANDTLRPFFQASDFRFEFNGELRFPVFWWFKGAVFVDGGNVWSLRAESERPGSELRWNSYKNIALGTGVGLRFDFGYSIIRLDMGLKVRQPFASTEAPNQWVNWRTTRWRDLSNFNLAVGYPF